MYKKLFDDFENIKAPIETVDEAVEKAVVLSDYNAVAISAGRKFFRKTVVCTMAACLVFVFVCTLVLGMRKNDTAQMVESNSFLIKANAALAPDEEVEIDDTVIGVYAGELTGGWAMYENLEKDILNVPNFFQSYCLNSLVIEGQNIESVTLKANKAGTYFAISPDGYYSAEENNQSVELQRFSDMSLSNSAYTEEELIKYKDGLSYGNIFCDEFTYSNVEKSEYINLGSKIEFILESNSNDERQALCLENIWLDEEEIVSKKEEGILSYEEYDRLYLDLSELSQELQSLILEDATVDVTVKFTDGTEQTQTLVMGLGASENGVWLTVSR